MVIAAVFMALSCVSRNITQYRQHLLNRSLTHCFAEIYVNLLTVRGHHGNSRHRGGRHDPINHHCGDRRNSIKRHCGFRAAIQFVCKQDRRPARTCYLANPCVDAGPGAGMARSTIIAETSMTRIKVIALEGHGGLRAAIHSREGRPSAIRPNAARGAGLRV
jgi:hypothetical protein